MSDVAALSHNLNRQPAGAAAGLGLIAGPGHPPAATTRAPFPSRLTRPAGPGPPFPARPVDRAAPQAVEGAPRTRPGGFAESTWLL